MVFIETDSTPSCSLMFSHLDSRKGKRENFTVLKLKEPESAGGSMHCGRVRGGDGLNVLDISAA